MERVGDHVRRGQADDHWRPGNRTSGLVLRSGPRGWRWLRKRDRRGRNGRKSRSGFLAGDLTSRHEAGRPQARPRRRPAPKAAANRGGGLDVAGESGGRPAAYGRRVAYSSSPLPSRTSCYPAGGRRHCPETKRGRPGPGRWRASLGPVSPISRAISARTRDSTFPGARGVMMATNRPCLVMKAGLPLFSIAAMTWAVCWLRSRMV
jgi:hypothetical protein